MPDNKPASVAIFLSYAREDAESARRIAEALRSSGVEVWFDQAELRGGDAWDAKLRTQIRSCTLFLPVISATTQARQEGYFRREWKFAVERLQDMAAGVAFIVPVVIDDTAESDALVPEEFMRVQWTRLPGALPTPQFVEQVKSLLGSRRKPALKPDQPRPPTLPPEFKQAAQKTEDRGLTTGDSRTGPKPALWLAILLGAFIGVAVYWATRAPVSGPAALPKPEPVAKAAPVATSPQSVAVLAFANLSDDKGSEYFSDGISEELLNVLAKVPGLKVSARTSAFYFKGKEVPIPEIAKQLGVAYVVEGSVRKAGDKVRITAQLIKAADGFHVWSDTFTRDLKDIFAVQDEIAGLIAKNLELKMGFAPGGARLAVSPEAYQEFLVGRAAAARAGTADMREAVTHFERAVALEPKYTAAWVQLASAHTQLGRWGGAPTLQSWAAARAAIDRAFALEPDSPDVLLALGWIRRTAEWDWRGAEQAFRRSLQLRPNHPDSLAGTAVLLFNIGQTEEAFRLGQQAAQLDPLNAATQIDLSIMFYLNHNWREAEQSAHRALQLAPEGGSYRSILGWSLTAQGRYDEAEAEIARDNNESEQAQALGSLAIARGQEPVARKWLARLEEIALTHGDNADVQMNIAWLSVGLGDKDRAFAALERARATRDPSLSWLRNSWYLDSLRTDPRWPVFLRKVGLADDQLK